MNVVLPDLTAGWLKREDKLKCSWYHWTCHANRDPNRFCECYEADPIKVLLPDQWAPLRELLTVECPNTRFHPKRDGYLERYCYPCKGTGLIPLPEGDYRIGTAVPSSNSLGWNRRFRLNENFAPLTSEPVHLRQVEWENVRRAPHSIMQGRRWVTPDPPSVLWVRPDFYDRLATSVDGGPPAGVLNVRSEK